MKTLPGDPVKNRNYRYRRISDDNYVLIAILEIESDPSALKSQTRCRYGSGSEYVVCSE